MKQVSVIYMTILCSCTYAAGGDVFREFVSFIEKFEKPYQNGTAEFFKRLNVFENNRRIQIHLNKFRNSEVSASYGITKFSDLTPDEFKGLYLQDLKGPSSIFFKWTPDKQNNHHHDIFSSVSLKGVPQKADWRSHGIISPVKNQKQCGACWAFSCVETVESMYAKKTGQRVPELSVQQVIDCADKNFGCSGGDTCRALQWMNVSHIPLVPNVDYPLKDTSDFCKMEQNGTKGVKISNYTCQRFVGHEDEMLFLLANVGPLTISVDATSWNNYQGGIIQFHCSNFNNHAVQIVGYDLTGEVPYYIIRNSWGTDFGINGYLYVKVAKNVCGVAQEVSTVMV